MNRTVRNILAICTLAIMAGCVAVALTASRIRRDGLTCTGLSVIIRDSLENSFVSRSDIKAYLDREAGGYIGKKADSIDLVKIERIIDGRSAVYKSEAYMTRDGKLNISVTQRKPVIRFQKSDGGFYADKDGFLFPLQRSYTAHVPVIDGHIPLKANSGYKGQGSGKEEQEWIEKMIGLVRYMEDNRLWSGNIVQISVMSNGDLVLIPRKGKEKFIFGKPDHFDEKFGRIEKYYTGIAPSKEPGYYSTVNVKYDGQIICRK